MINQFNQDLLIYHLYNQITQLESFHLTIILHNENSSTKTTKIY